jgi:hypothetical protein
MHKSPTLSSDLYMSRSYTSSHRMRLHGVYRDHFTFYLFICAKFDFLSKT